MSEQGVLEPVKLLIGNTEKRLSPVRTEFDVEACSPSVGFECNARGTSFPLPLFESKVDWRNRNASSKNFGKAVESPHAYRKAEWKAQREREPNRHVFIFLLITVSDLGEYCPGISLQECFLSVSRETVLTLQAIAI